MKMRLKNLTVILIFGCALSACGQRIAITRAALPCSELVPPQLSDPTPGADLPNDPSKIVDMQVFADAQTGQLDKANLTKAASLEIIRLCEARDKEIDETLTKRKSLF